MFKTTAPEYTCGVKNRQAANYFVHRLVMLSFLERVLPIKLTVDYLDEKKCNKDPTDLPRASRT